MSLKISETKIIWKSILLFFFIYDVALRGIPTKLSSRKIAFIIFSLICLNQCFRYDRKIVASGKVIKYYSIEIGICIFSLFHVFIRAFIHGLEQSEYVEYPYVVYFIIFGLLAPICIILVFQDLEEFLKTLILASLYQAIFVVLEFNIWPLKVWLSENITTTSNILYTDTDRATGLGASGAALSVWLFFGIYACIYFILTKKKHMKYWNAALVILVAQFLSARTGFYTGIVSIIVVEIVRNKNIKVLRRTFNKVSMMLLAIVGAITFSLYMGNIDVDDKLENLIYLVNRNFNISRIIGNNSFFSTFFSMGVPPLSIETFLGYGVISGNNLEGELLLRHDSGFIMRYFADGLFMAIIEYSFFAVMLITMWKSIKSKKLRGYTIGLILVIFLVEIKEPFMYYYSGVAVVLCILMLSLRFRSECYAISNSADMTNK